MKLKTRVTKSNAREILVGLSPLCRLLATAAFELGYQVDVYKNTNLFRVAHQGKFYLVSSAYTPLNVYSSAQITDNKYFTNAILKEAGIPVPPNVPVRRAEFKRKEWSLGRLSAPWVVKPLKGTLKGNGVVTDIIRYKDLRRYLRRGLNKYPSMLIEKYYSGLQDYRVLVLDHKIIGVLHRIPAYVIGDGRSSIRQLILAKNKQRQQSKVIKLGPIKVDSELRNKLKHQHLSLHSVPKLNKRVQLKNVCNFGAGGEVHDVTRQICRENANLAVKATKALDLRLAGIDFLCTDISKPLRRTGGVIIELNQHPDIAMHHFPQLGQPRCVAREIVQAFFQQ